MKIKKISILLLSLLLTGCTVNYNLEIKENGIIFENITGTVTNKELDNEGRTDENIYSYNLNSRTPLIRDRGIYNKNIIENNTFKDFAYSYEFVNNYKDSSAINICYEDVTFSETDELYYIDLKGDFKCLYSENLTINVTTKYKVLKSNADKIKDNTYTWNITSKKDSDIYMTISKEIKEPANKISKFRIFVFIILIILAIVTYILYKKTSINNEI